jgi:hypothetical protein
MLFEGGDWAVECRPECGPGYCHFSLAHSRLWYNPCSQDPGRIKLGLGPDPHYQLSIGNI